MQKIGRRVGRSVGLLVLFSMPPFGLARCKVPQQLRRVFFVSPSKPSRERLCAVAERRKRKIMKYLPAGAIVFIVFQAYVGLCLSLLR